MNPVAEFIESGVLELYVMGACSPEEVREVHEMAAAHPQVRQALDERQQAMEQYALAHALQPRATVKTLVLATVDYLERMKGGELPESPPVLSPTSKVGDFSKWLQHEEAILPEGAESMHARIIGYTPQSTTAILWVQDRTEEEVHHEEHERFLIVEGTCQLIVSGKEHALAAGDYFEIPLDASHHIKVTSASPCKAILQRLSIA
ncbi:cupin domain-containing protein [Pontibacter mangrovi]|uniref:Cupin domain-containing protein n=1 Tax=Pontibacter mangrovi TaxID=2589816 RepID=A0A501VZF7_9BACT|nr:cupin domain-containing protein [Pontibacter mangrovi]TPE42809.1 cupin domain-containing protein [Pontibacter mangrovi]